MSKLAISEKLKLPIDVTTQALAFLGRRGSGKSYAATKLAELLYANDAQFVAVDPVGIWYGLRLGADGKSEGINVPIFGGLHGDIPIAATAGAMLADVIVDRGVSAVLDVSQFESEADKARFARDFAARFFFRKKASPSAVHLFVEEAQEFIPQNIQRGEEQMLHAFQRMIRLGRNYGIGVSMISQRPQDVNKKALNQAECLFCFQLTGPQERKAVEDWVSDKGLSDDLSRLLPNLQVGHAHVWSPVWLDLNEEVLIAKKETFPAGSTPKVGARPVAMKPLAPIELEKIQKDMAATIEQAKANDPAALKRRIAELEKQLASRPKEQVEKIVEKTVEVPVLKNGQLDRTEKILGRLQDFADKALAETSKLRSMIAPATVPRPAAKTLQAVRPRPVSRPAPEARVAPAAGAGDPGIDKCARKILAVLANYPDGAEIGKIALLAGYRVSGGFRNSLSALRSAGYIDGENTGTMKVTEAGLENATPENIPTGQDFVNYWLNHASLDKCAKAILSVLVNHPEGMQIAELAVAAGYEVSGGFRNALSDLRTAGAIVGKNTGTMCASDELLEATNP